MKSSFSVSCNCGKTFRVHVSGNNLPKSAQCPECKSIIWLVEPLGNVVGMAILSRAEAELQKGDCTLAIVLAAMAVECELVHLFMKWNRIDLMSVRNPTDADDEAWETQWRDKVGNVAARFDKVSSLLTGKSFDAFLSQNSGLLKGLHSQYPASKCAESPRDFFVTQFFRKRNKTSITGKSPSASKTQGCAWRRLQHSG